MPPESDTSTASPKADATSKKPLKAATVPAAPAAAKPGNPVKRTAAELEPVMVLNRSPAKYHHDGIDCEPGTAVEVPRYVAEIWRKVSSGHVIPQDEVDRSAKENASKLAKAEEKNLELEAKLAKFEERIKELEARGAD